VIKGVQCRNFRGGEMQRYHIQLPVTEYSHLSQSEAYLYLIHENGEREKILFHDYERLYELPGLYEQIFYDRLRCKSPTVIAQSLQKALRSSMENFNEMRVLDLGAGNGLMGEALKEYGVSRLVGVDISEKAKTAVLRDRPGLYDSYHVSDFTQLEKKEEEELKSWSFDCLTCVAALGFGDIPVQAFLQAMNLIDSQGWVAFNIKESFLRPSDQSGFSRFIKSLILSEYMDVYFIERYRHRLSVEGAPLFYFSIVAKKKQHIPHEMVLNL
jgi:predicted TPR repeat methyltransferase